MTRKGVPTMMIIDQDKTWIILSRSYHNNTQLWFSKHLKPKFWGEITKVENSTEQRTTNTRAKLYTEDLINRKETEIPIPLASHISSQTEIEGKKFSLIP